MCIAWVDELLIQYPEFKDSSASSHKAADGNRHTAIGREPLNDANNSI
jgi:hypothetical protein